MKPIATREHSADILESGRAFAEAYAHGDFERVEALLDPDVQYREITPSGIVQATGRAAILEEQREFLGRYDPHETLELNVERVGDRVGAQTRWRLHGGTETKVVEWCEYMTVKDGRITALDAVCSGPMLEQ